MARRVEVAAVAPGVAVRAALIDHAAVATDRWAALPGSPWLRTLSVLEDRAVPVLFHRWQIRDVWPDAEHGAAYYLDPDDTIREAVRDGDTWR